MHAESDEADSNLDAPLREVEGRVAFITGGSSGIGLGLARACADAGMNVVITYRTPTHLREAEAWFRHCPSRFLARRVDVTDRDAMQRAADAAEKRFGNVHLLCNNAGVGVGTPIAAATYADWDFAMSVNVGGVINGVQTFLPRMLSSGEPAHIMTTSSMSGLFHGSDAGIYTTTKFAVVGMMEALRAELVPRGIGVSVFCPGLVASNLHHVDRNRPTRLRHARMSDSERRARIGSLMKHGMDPYECGVKVLQGIRRNAMYIITHPEYARGVGDRHEALMAAFAAAREPVPPERLRAEQRVLRNPVYAAAIASLDPEGKESPT